MPSSGLGWGAAPNGGVKVSWGLVHKRVKNGVGDQQVDRCSVFSNVYKSVVEKERVEPKGKAFWSIFAPTLICGHELWVMTERTRLQIQATEISFLLGMAGLSTGDVERIVRKLGGLLCAMHKQFLV